MLINLQKINISDLEKEKVHSGKFLELKLIKPCFKKNAIMMLAEDDTTDNCIQIGLLNYTIKNSHYDLDFPIDTLFYLKEPYLTIASLGKIPLLRIDNPEDIILENHPEAIECFGAPNPFKKK